MPPRKDHQRLRNVYGSCACKNSATKHFTRFPRYSAGGLAAADSMSCAEYSASSGATVGTKRILLNILLEAVPLQML